MRKIVAAQNFLFLKYLKTIDYGWDVVTRGVVGMSSRLNVSRILSSKILVLLIACTIGISLSLSSNLLQQQFAEQSDNSTPWYKGNTHTHTTKSDGDSSPDDVVRWYKEHGYQFLVLSDHNFLTDADALNALHGADESFLVIPGEEVSDQFQGKPVHINGLNLSALVSPQGGNSVANVLQRNVDAIRAALGVPHINHPNFHWAITVGDLQQVENDRLLEIYNGHPFSNNGGGGGMPSVEEVWDTLLSSGKVMYGIADDDAHHFTRPWDPTSSRPGKGWVMVRADRLSAESIVGAMDRGDFYASTGVELDEYTVARRTMTITVKPGPTVKYRIQFIGRHGRLLKEVDSNTAIYTLRGGEGYVRARITDSNGCMAWTQPKLLYSFALTKR
jgi:hypothetical protein